ncbi:ring-cleaving dioxygenase, partial [Metarhizobium album]
SGGNEMSLLPLARRTAPDATLLALRGRSTEEGVPRWFRRFGPLSFDQKDIASEAEALAAFLDEAERVYDIDMARSIFLGHSNGANFLAAFLLLYPQRLRNVVLLRPVPVLTEPPAADLNGTNVLLLAGEDDPFRPQAEPLLQGLTAAGANARLLQVTGAGHDLSPADVPLMRNWLVETA